MLHDLKHFYVGTGFIYVSGMLCVMGFGVFQMEARIKKYRYIWKNIIFLVEKEEKITV